MYTCAVNGCHVFSYLDDVWVGKGIQQDVHVMSQLQGVNQVVMVTSGDLHEAHKSEV